MKDKKSTVTDVARLAGVSIGTVDRVIHDRGEVSPKTREKVLAAIEASGYRMNPYASMLAAGKQYRIACLVPRLRAGEYWELVYNGISLAAERNRDYNVSVDIYQYEQFDITSFRKATGKLLAASPGGVLIAPMYREDTIALTSRLNDSGIPYVYIDSKIEDTSYTAYFGLPMYGSGRLAASLVLDRHPATIANFRIERGGGPLDNPTIRRREGFFDYVAEHAPGCNIINETLRPYDAVYNETVLEKFFSAGYPKPFIVTFNSRVHLIAAYMAKYGIMDTDLLGYDMLPDNIGALRDGHVKYLIAQRTETQALNGINALADLLVFKKTPAVKDNFSSMDILTKENVEFYYSKKA